jgi:hypothetical protein
VNAGYRYPEARRPGSRCALRPASASGRFGHCPQGLRRLLVVGPGQGGEAGGR